MEEKDVRAKLKKHWNVPLGEATTRARDEGFIFGLQMKDGGRKMRYVTYKFPTGRAMVAERSTAEPPRGSASSS